MADSSPFKLIIEDDEGRRSIIPIDLGSVDIGRLESNTIRLDERNVSRQHARLLREKASIFAEDLDSYNGVWINGDRIQGRHEVHEGDLLRIGDFHLELRGEGLQRRHEETTQRTTLPDSEVTQTQFRMEVEPTHAGQVPPAAPFAPPAAPPAPTPGSSSASGPQPALVSGAAPVSAPVSAHPVPEHRNTPPPPAPVADDEPAAHEATAIIRMDAPELRAPRGHTGPIAGQKAKLICVSTRFAGQSFEIGKAEVVVGRTSDNDISIDHRSVSRHHAKIVIANRRYLLHDLKSANGTLVNGETYAQTELKRGDLIEFGHVKLRFVPPGESYTLTADELAAARTAETEERERTPARGEPRPYASSRVLSLPTPIVVAGGILTLVLVAVVTALFMRQTNERGRPAGNAALAGTQNAGEIETLLGRGHGLLAQRRWDQAASVGTQVLSLDSANAAARELIAKAQAERQAQTIYDEAQKAVEAGDWWMAWKALQGLPATSVYAEQSRALTERVRNALVADLIAKARASLEAQDFEAAAARASEIASIDSNRAEAIQIRGDIDRARATQRRAAVAAAEKAGPPKQPAHPPTASTQPNAAAPAPRTPVKPPPPPAAPANPAAGNAAAGGGEDAKAIYGDAVALLKAGDVNGSIEALNRCIQIDSAYAGCYRALGIAYARSGNGPKAAKYYKQYLKVNPDAPDGDKVRQLLEQYETAP